MACACRIPTLVLDLTICNLLRSGTAQLSTYATREQPTAPKTVVLVVTRRKLRLAVGTAGQECARAWLSRHSEELDDVIWLSGGQVVSSGSDRISAGHTNRVGTLECQGLRW